MSDTGSGTRRSTDVATTATGSASATHDPEFITSQAPRSEAADSDIQTTDLPSASTINYSTELLAKVKAQAAQLTLPDEDEERKGTEYDQRLRAIKRHLRKDKWGYNDDHRTNTADLITCYTNSSCYNKSSDMHATAEELAPRDMQCAEWLLGLSRAGIGAQTFDWRQVDELDARRKAIQGRLMSANWDAKESYKIAADITLYNAQQGAREGITVADLRGRDEACASWSIDGRDGVLDTDEFVKFYWKDVLWAGIQYPPWGPVEGSELGQEEETSDIDNQRGPRIQE